MVVKTNKSLSFKQQDSLIEILKARFEKNIQRHLGIEWVNVELKLRTNIEKLWSLNQMELSGGEPDVVAYDENLNEFVFYDC